MTDFDVVVGSGLWGCTVARLLAERGRKVVVLETRNEIGGNSHAFYDSNGIEVHKYGSHIFHTSDSSVWNFVKRFTEFNSYSHSIIAVHNGKKYRFPVGLELINDFFNENLVPSEVDDFLSKDGNRDRLIDAFFAGYTAKQWGITIDRIDMSVIKRIPFRNNYNTSYFNDIWQGIPLNGYEKLFENILNHENITLELGFDFHLDDGRFSNCRKFYSGSIDSLFDYKYGKLPWRSLRFEFETVNVKDYQGISIMNYSDVDVPYTRIHEFKHFHPECSDIMEKSTTVICREYPVTWGDGMEKYYPVLTKESNELLKLYETESKKQRNLTIGGRLGKYKYFDMDDTIKDAISSVESCSK